MTWSTPVRLSEERNGDGSQNRPLTKRQPDRCGEERVPVGEVGGAIQGIDAPTQPVLFTGGTAFFSQNSDVWGFSAEHLKNNAFGCHVRIGDEITNAPFAFNRAQPPVVAHQLSPTCVSGLSRHSHQGAKPVGVQTSITGRCTADR